MKVNTNPEMNTKIANILSNSDQPMVLYAAARIEELEEALREIDTHIRSTPESVQYIVETLKRVLPEYQEGVTVEWPNTKGFTLTPRHKHFMHEAANC